MSRPAAALKAVPDEAPMPEEGCAVLNLTGDLEGQWVEYETEPSARLIIALLRAQDDYAGALDAAAKRIKRHSFGGDILDQPVRTLMLIVKAWNTGADADALDPTPAGD